MKHTLFFLLAGLSLMASAQNTRKALFLGNSYTYVNNLPQLTADIALSVNDTLVYDSHAPGGYTLQGHFTNTVSKGKIMAGGWDYVVLQEQSQLPSFPDVQVESDVYPYAVLLDSLIDQYNGCAKTMFYMTWGRKNGDASNCASWPPVCTYAGMDSLLHLRYVTMANNNAAELSPAGAVWKYIRENYPAIELYQPDESHPSTAGSYAAGVCFYTAIFRKDPTLVTYNFTLSPADAATIRAAVKTVVYDHLADWNIGVFDPVAGFTYVSSGMNATFTNTSENTGAFAWNFGDGSFSTATNPVHTYAAAGTYTVELVAGCGLQADTLVYEIEILPVSVMPHETFTGSMVLSPNPADGSAFDLLLAVDGKNAMLTVSDATGRVCFSMPFLPVQNGKAVHIQCPAPLAPGTYLVCVKDNRGVYTKKMVVK